MLGVFWRAGVWERRPRVLDLDFGRLDLDRLDLDRLEFDCLDLDRLDLDRLDLDRLDLDRLDPNGLDVDLDRLDLDLRLDLGLDLDLLRLDLDLRLSRTSPPLCLLSPVPPPCLSAHSPLCVRFGGSLNSSLLCAKRQFAPALHPFPPSAANSHILTLKKFSVVRNSDSLCAYGQLRSEQLSGVRHMLVFFKSGLPLSSSSWCANVHLLPLSQPPLTKNVHITVLENCTLKFFGGSRALGGSRSLPIVVRPVARAVLDATDWERRR